MVPDADGSALLTGPDADELLTAVVSRAGGRLGAWALDHVDVHPGHATTATFSADIAWPTGVTRELIGVSVRASGPRSSDRAESIVWRHGRAVVAWLHPHDPDLPGLPRLCYPDAAAAVLNQSDALAHPVRADEVSLSMLTYRPRRRAVVRMDVSPAVASIPATTIYGKALRPGGDIAIVERLQMLHRVGLPAAPIAAHLPNEAIVLLAALPGEPLSRAMFQQARPCTAEQVVDLLDALPYEICQLPRRDPWSDALAHYAGVVSASVPGEGRRLDWLVRTLQPALAEVPAGDEPTHGDFHEGQLHVAGGAIVGVLDLDTLGPGRRVDDLACLVAHLSTVQRMNPTQQGMRDNLLRRWVPVFDERVDPVQLRLRAAAVIVSLATGPFRSQEDGWQRSTSELLDAAEALVRQVR